MMNRSRSIWTPITVNTLSMSTRAGVQNYYDILKVHPSATQDEIKSAYYKLTKQYHPDKNQTDEAKAKFQNVSNAYEVLGNYVSRKKYDRDFSMKNTPVERNFRPTVRNEPRRSHPHTNIHNTAYSTGGRKVFDFDEWTRAHYSNKLESNFRFKQFKMHQQMERAAREEYHRKHQASTTELYTIAFGLVTFLVLYVGFDLFGYHNYDTVKYPPINNETNKREQKEKT